jgi:glyoxylase-like metal-dependent hydrolase (beta-lactamase superfamily II)
MGVRFDMTTHRDWAGFITATSLAYVTAVAAALLAPSVVCAQGGPRNLLPPELAACDDQPLVTGNVPASAAPVPDPSRGEFSGGFFHVGRVSGNVFYLTDGAFQGAFVVMRSGIIGIDAPPLIGANPRDPTASVNIVDVIFSIPETQGLEIKKLIYSHSHLDHIGAASFMQDAFSDVEIIAQRETFDAIRRGAGTMVPNLQQDGGSRPLPLPTRKFRKRHTVRLGGASVEFSYRGPIHEPGNIFIRFPGERVLMFVDGVAGGQAPFTSLNASIDIPLFLEAPDRILAFGFDTLIGGHFTRLSTRADVEELRVDFQDIEQNALADPTTFAIFSILPQNPLVASIIRNEEASRRCANRTLDPRLTPSGVEWRGRLAGADVTTVTHCAVANETLQIDSAF